MVQIEQDSDEIDFEDRRLGEDEHALSPAGIAEQNDGLLRRYRDFRRAADAVVAAWRNHPEVVAAALVGSLAVAPWKEVPRFAPYRRAQIALWHECKDVDLAVWLAYLRDLDGLRRAKDRALRELQAASGAGVASHQVDVFVLEPGSDRYLGRLCRFNRCPKGKTECLVSGCGATKFLQQHQDFRWQPESLAADRVLQLFDRTTGRLARATELPLPTGKDKVDDMAPS
jgi:hypothetical protein